MFLIKKNVILNWYIIWNEKKKIKKIPLVLHNMANQNKNEFFLTSRGCPKIIFSRLHIITDIVIIVISDHAGILPEILLFRNPPCTKSKPKWHYWWHRAWNLLWKQRLTFQDILDLFHFENGFPGFYLLNSYPVSTFDFMGPFFWEVFWPLGVIFGTFTFFQMAGMSSVL